MRTFAVALIVSLSAGFAPAAEVANPYKNAKVGDKLEYKMSVKTTAGAFEGTMTQEVTGKTNKEVTIKTTTKMLGREQPAQTTKIDLTKEFDPSTMGGRGGKVEKVEKLMDGIEKVKVGGKEYECTWVTYKVALPEGVPAGFGETELKVWLSKDVAGLVKMTAISKVMNQDTGLTLELVDTVSKK